MKTKKTPRADLQNKRGLFFEIGLCVSLMLAIAFFMWSQPTVSISAVPDPVTGIPVELPPITTQQPEPPARNDLRVNVVADIIKIVESDKKITEGIYIPGLSDDFPIVFHPATTGGGTEAPADEVIDFLVIEDQPLFQGQGVNAFRSWVNGQIVYPTIAQENNIKGRVTVSFVIERDGSLTSIEVLAAPDRLLANEAVRVLAASPLWTPGKQRGIPVRVRYTIPIDFRLE